MKKIVRIFFGLAGFALLALAFMPMSEHRAAASNPLPVAVTNVPLPVQGTVSVGNSPSVNVANSPSVNVANTPNVNVTNSALAVSNALDSSNNPVPVVVIQQGQPYQDSCSTGGTNTCAFLPLPSGMRLVIQEFDSRTTLALPGVVEDVLVRTQVNGTFQNHGFFAAGSQTSTAGFYTVHHPTTMYADAGSAPRCFIDSDVTITPAFCAISGYLVPAP